MKITKEIAYKFIKETGTMGKYDFNIVDIFTESYKYPFIRCEYTEGATTFHTQYKNVHIDLINFQEWTILNRQNLLDELLNNNLK
jgi:hypothetical protein